MPVKSILFVVSFNADISMFVIFFNQGDLLMVENEVLKSPTSVLELIVVYIYYYVFYEIRCPCSELCSFNGLSSLSVWGGFFTASGWFLSLLSQVFEQGTCLFASSICLGYLFLLSPWGIACHFMVRSISLGQQIDVCHWPQFTAFAVTKYPDKKQLKAARDYLAHYSSLQHMAVGRLG